MGERVTPVAWRVKDFADGWTYTENGAHAAAAKIGGHAVEPLYANLGEEFLEFKEALADLRSLRAEYECLNGGGPNWQERNRAAWAKVDELFADEDEAAYDRQQESFYG